MRKLRIALPLLTFAMAIVSVVGSVALSHVGIEPLLAAQESEAKSAEGELVKVDLDNHTLTIKLENGDEMQFLFNSDTAVEGRDNGVQGLTSDAGTRLTITYKDDAGKKIATKITIKKSEG